MTLPLCHAGRAEGCGVGCRRLTDDVSLEVGAAEYSVNLSEATKLQEEDFLSRAADKIVDWLQQEHLGLVGWAWLALGITAAVLTCATCCVTRARSKKPFVPPAVTNRLPQAVSARLPAAATRPSGLASAPAKRSTGAAPPNPYGDSVPVYVRNAAPEDFAASGGIIGSAAAPPPPLEGGRREVVKSGSLLRGRHAHDQDGYVDHVDLVDAVEVRQAAVQGGWGIRETGIEMAKQMSRTLSRTVSSPRRGYKRLDEPERQPPPPP